STRRPRVDDELDVTRGLLVELGAVLARPQSDEARDLAQRLLKVVRDDVGVLLELLVGPLKLKGALGDLALELVVSGAQLGLSATELRDRGREREDRGRVDAQKALEQQQGFVDVGPGEKTEAGQRRVH